MSNKSRNSRQLHTWNVVENTILSRRREEEEEEEKEKEEAEEKEEAAAVAEEEEVEEEVVEVEEVVVVVVVVEVEEKEKEEEEEEEEEEEIKYTPLPCLELVGHILQEPGQLNGVLLEHVSTETGQPWIAQHTSKGAYYYTVQCCK